MNTDFAQVEEDTQQVNLTRFSLFFPEKRDFFLEGQGLFSFGGEQRGGGGGGQSSARTTTPSLTPVVFYSRRIGLRNGLAVPLLGGGRLTGRAGPFVIGAIDSLLPHMRPGQLLILESTTYPGTTTELVGPILSSVTGLVPGVDFHLGYSPERIDPGNRMHTLVNTPKVVSGVDADSLSVVDAFFGVLVDRTVPVASCEEAETVKLLENTFRHVNIALVNELAVFANELGIDIWNVIDAASTEPFGYMRFTPGPGVGGHCLPVFCRDPGHPDGAYVVRC